VKFVLSSRNCEVTRHFMEFESSDGVLVAGYGGVLWGISHNVI
jgi:hypothetical protein